MARQHGDRRTRGDRDGERLRTRLGPPGWDEFRAARRRFETTLAVEALERAFAAPATDPPRGGGERWPR